MEYRISNDLTATEYNCLRNQLGWAEKDLDVINIALKKSSFIKKITIQADIVGMARVIGDGIYYLIVDVIVSPKFQGKGYGKILIEELEKEIKNSMNNGEKCFINLISMKDKEIFYEKCGFEKIPSGITGYGMRKIIEK